MFHRFQYEAEFYPGLDRLPLHVRMKFDLTGIKLSLKQWLAFSFEERKVVCHLPAESEEELEAFVAYMNFLCGRYSGSGTNVGMGVTVARSVDVTVGSGTVAVGVAVGQGTRTSSGS